MTTNKFQFNYLKKYLIGIKFILFLVFFSSQLYSQSIAINEVMASNSATITDEDGSFEDWIEIYNYGTTAVNIGGYGLTDDVTNLYQWVFPSYTLQPKEFLLVWASGKDRSISTQPLHSNFKIKSGGEVIVLTNSAGTQINTFPAVAVATDVSYGRQPDGTGSWKFFNTPTPRQSNSGTANSETEKIAINEIMNSNNSILADEDGDFNDWIEIYNYGTTSVNLTGYGLSDDSTLPFKWTFPSMTIAPNEYILVWASDKNRAITGQPLHTNFKIGSTGETILLKNPSGVVVSGSPSVGLNVDVSYGRQPDGTGSWLYFDSPTPGSSNIGSGTSTALEPPTFSHTSGLYTSDFNLTLSTTSPGATIIYTLDGSEPDINNLNGSTFQYKNVFPHVVGTSFGPMLEQSFISFAYNSPLKVSDRSNDPDVLAIKNTLPDDIYIPPIPVKKSTVLRAKVYLNGQGSKTRTRNYFVWPNGNPYNVPIVALTGNEGNLFEYTTGIYTPGAIFDQWRTDNPSGNQPKRSEFNNFGQSGDEWERKVNVQIFNNKLESVLNQDAGLRIHGNTSRGQHLKNLRLYARSEYDEQNEFEFNLIKQKIPNSPNLYNDKFKRLLLRGNGSGGYIANDVVFNRSMQPFFNGIMRIETAINFINGEYFGLTAFRDRFDEHHIANNFGLDSGNIDIVGCISGCANEEGDPGAFSDLKALFDYIKATNLQVNSNYDYVKSRLDVDSFIDQLFLEIFSEGDSYETKFWRATNVVDNNFGDGKWRVYSQDFESAMKSSINWLDNFLETSITTNKGLLTSLMKNEEFKNKTLNRFSDLMNTGFTETRFTEIVNYTFDEIAPLIVEDRNRSPRERFYTSGDKRRLLEWILERPTAFREQIKVAFAIDKTINLNLNVSNLNAGFIKLNSIDVNSNTPGVNQKAYPWSGIYFNNIPITLEAKAMPGYTFSYWAGDASGTNSKITIVPSEDLSVRAIFAPDEDYSHLLYFWLFDANIENDIPLESLNSTYSRNDLTAVMNYNSSLDGYPFEANNPNWRKASLERSNNPIAINYQTIANNNIAYAPEIMKGLQIKQPFKSGSLENNFELNFSTVGYEDIKISLAINSDGAVNTIIADYWNGSNWVSTSLINGSQSISSEYELKEFDFTNVSLADENESFKVRFTFNGTNMTEETGKKVIFNNIAISAVDKNVLSADEYQKEEQSISIYPNPVKDKIKIFSNSTIKNVLVYNVLGKLVYKSSEKLNNLTIDLSNFSKGIYFVKVLSDGASQTKKIIKE